MYLLHKNDGIFGIEEEEDIKKLSCKRQLYNLLMYKFIYM